MEKTLWFGSTGPAVSALQTRLNELILLQPVPAVYPTLLQTDGIFGAKTLARVKEFQSQNGLTADGIVGPLTWAKLRENAPTPINQAPHVCDCSRAAHSEPVLRQLLAAYLGESQASPAPSGPKNGGMQLASFLGSPRASFSPASISVPKFRRLTTPEEKIVEGSYGSSIDFTRVFLTDQTGLDNRAFVVATRIPFNIGPVFQIVNIGPPGSYSDHTLVHEMGHVWQSQHHTDHQAYIGNALASQAAAIAANKAMGVDTYSAYAYRPGRAFASYGAEQIAQQVANGEAAIVSHVKAFPPHLPDPTLVLAMKIPRFEDSAAAGVRK